MSSSKNGGAPKPASPYARFIPREELNSFAAWKPGALTGNEDAPQAPVQRAEPPAPPAPPKPSPEEELAAHVKAARTSGYQDGYRDGLVALDGFKQSYAAQITAQMGAIAESYNRQLDALQQDMARALAVSATHLARQIVRSELKQRPELVAAVAQEAVDTLLRSAQHITLRVHPDDHALVAQGAAEVIEARGGRVISDSEITRGGCVVESDIGVIDASVETRWRRAAASLGCDERWNGGPSADEDTAMDDERGTP
ncbi:FliH/SctL family protein [Piscinibacter gummiphilus]|uniref:Flagellar assembly protein FliH n=1 Tax=Piscinibacter gummiphilus TaxID=946333 RepID=A0ABZ0CY46_9BURK|nr:FliH/SctL family protein [Piscinibacter gummiphilus]WOB09818.1 FliH/SctL family protein [Piscinibacter gummiphilus]